MTADLKQYIADNTVMIVGIFFLLSFIVMQVLHILKANIFKVIVMVGTFALALAFASNDLVNFLGVPLAGFYPYNTFIESHPDTMSCLNEPASTPFLFLFIAGIIMDISITTSKKARNVTKTAVSLAAQDKDGELFGTSKLARSLVRSCTKTAEFLERVLPNSVKSWIDSRFRTNEAILEKGAAFDLVRACVNLVCAFLPVALGTSLKLPLSTTYVAFMVTMGTSLADCAWSRESAGYRITGMLSVIGGWFVTAGAAFVLALVAVLIIHFTGVFGALAVMLIAIGILIHSQI